MKVVSIMRIFTFYTLTTMFLAGCSVLSAESTNTLLSVEDNAPLNFENFAPVGGNLEGVRDWSRSNVFVDLVKQSRGFNTVDKYWLTTSPVSKDQTGWPTEDFGIFLMTGVGASKITTGNYSFHFKGRATVSSLLAKNLVKIRNLNYNSETDITTGNVFFPSGQTSMALSFTNTVGGIKDLKIIRPGYSFDLSGNHQVFTREFLEHMNRFSILRFKDWTNTDNSVAVQWDNRPRESDPVYTSAQGVPWELVIQLSKELKKDVWINVPHLANKSYVEGLAKFFATKLHPHSKLWLEYSNELWNWSYKQAQWNLAQAKIEVARGASPLNYDNSKNSGYWAWRRAALKTKEVGDIFRQEFGKRQRGDQLKIVLSGQFAQLRSYTEALEFHKFNYSNPSDYYECLGAGIYFNSKSVEKLSKISSLEVLSSLRASLYTVKVRIRNSVTFSQKHNIPFCAYEAGPDTYGSSHVKAKEIANGHVLMGDMTYELLETLFANNFLNVNWFMAGASSWSGNHGAWGLTHDMGIKNTSKIKALDDFIRNYSY